MTRAESSLLNIITLNAIYIRKDETIDLDNPIILTLMNNIVEKARMTDKPEVAINPEQFAENLLIKGSLIGATVSLIASTKLR